jgi:hypothetical protein
VSHGVEVAGADEEGGVPGEVTVGDTVTEGIAAGVPGIVVVVAVGVTDGVGVALEVGVGVVEGGGVDVVAGGDWTGPTRLGPVLRWPVSNSAAASALAVSVTGSTGRGCGRAASVQPPTCRTGAAADETGPTKARYARSAR